MENIHWEPYHKTCNPCQADYFAIGHLETFAEDVEYILNASNLHKYVSNVGWKHVTTNGSTNLWTEEYFSQVSCKLLTEIYNLYELDFELFGYDPSYYFSVCKDEKQTQND